MRMWWQDRIARAPDGVEGGGGGAEGGASPGAPPSADPLPGDPGSLFDAVEEAEPKAGEDGKPVRPKDVPEQFWDPEAGAVRTEAVLKSWRDLRAKVSQGREAPPEKPEAYTLPAVEGLPEGAIGGEGDTLWPEMRKAAHAAGISQKQFDALARPFLAAVAAQLKEGGGTADPEAAAAAMEEARQAELAKLGPNARQVVKDIGGWLAGLQANGVFTAEEIAGLRGVSTAAGMRALGKLRELSGEKPIPTDAIATDAATLTDLQRQMTDAFAKGDQATVDRVRRQLEEMERKGLLPAA